MGATDSRGKPDAPCAPARRLAALALLPWLALAPAHAGETASPEFIADCVAVMQSRADELARQVKAGDTGQQAALRVELQRAAALIGRAYLDGERDEADAKARLKAAQDHQGTRSDTQREALHAACERRADAELATANVLQRFIVERVAQARMNRMLGGH